jgi:hypothetical protein
MEDVFYDNNKVLAVRPAESGLSISTEFFETLRTVAPAQPGEGPAIAAVRFLATSRKLREDTADAYVMLSVRGVDMTALDDYILAQYL